MRLLAILCCAFLISCSGETKDSPSSQSKQDAGLKTEDVPKGRLVADVPAAIRSVLPDGWAILQRVEDTYPSYRPKGSGRGFFIGQVGKSYPKIPYDVALYVMPADYEDGGPDPTGGHAMTYPARLMAEAENAKIYLWGFGSNRELCENLRNAVIEEE